MEIKDLWEGDGPVAEAGANVSVHYVGVAFSTGEEFDASWNRGRPLQFQLGAGQVISGWDRGVQGMKVGGRRQLIIPPHLAYGDRGDDPSADPTETMQLSVPRDIAGLPRRRRGRTLAAAHPEGSPQTGNRLPERSHTPAESAARFGAFRRALQGNTPAEPAEPARPASPEPEDNSR
nr:FKBP-type peptidyl-prolyl cis-trans isomerase [Streptomyces spiramenti]